MDIQKKLYTGVETGPIRPPSEAGSLLVRVTRNCPWNQCRFCGLFKGEKFSVRPVEHVLKDIDYMKEHYDRTQVRSVFLQDANSLVMKPDDLAEILRYIKASFPHVERITSYARSHTVARISDENLKMLAGAGLNRIHIGMETASDTVLQLVQKGVDKATHIAAGQKVKRAGMELSEYYMPGLGGREYLEESALETADAMNHINPDFIRIRSLAIPDDVPLSEDYQAGIFTRTNDTAMVEELLLFIENLKGITSTVKSDHILNLLPEVEGLLPQDQDKMLDALKWYLDLSEEEQILFRIGRRTGVMNDSRDLLHPAKRMRVIRIVRENNISTTNIDEVTDGLMKRFI
ncbi:MAG: radical SAM protein [Clostridia bacterium]|jgi:hypothetical protein|nr:radical SAM protein [Clostridia bacterium]